MFFFFFTFSLGEGPTLLCGQSYPNSKYLFWKFRHVRGQWKNIFHFVFQREEFLRLLGTLNGNSIKCIFGKLSARKDIQTFAKTRCYSGQASGKGGVFSLDSAR